MTRRRFFAKTRTMMRGGLRSTEETKHKNVNVISSVTGSRTVARLFYMNPLHRPRFVYTTSLIRVQGQV